MMKKLTSKQVVDLLLKDSGNYLLDTTVYNDECDDIGQMSDKVFNNLLDSGKIIFAKEREFFGGKYYILKK